MEALLAGCSILIASRVDAKSDKGANIVPAYVGTRSVPTTVSLEMLAKFAVLVDFYELAGAEVIERDTSAWIADVRKRIAVPTTYCRDLVLWIFVAQVFNLTEEFEKAVAVAIHESRGPIQTLGLQIREKTTCKFWMQLLDINC